MHEKCVSDSPNPLNRNQAKAKIRSLVGKFVDEELNIKLNNKIISDDDLSYFFNHKEHGSFYLKPEYSDANKLIAFISNNQNKFSFLQATVA